MPASSSAAPVAPRPDVARNHALAVIRTGKFRGSGKDATKAEPKLLRFYDEFVKASLECKTVGLAKLIPELEAFRDGTDPKDTRGVGGNPARTEGEKGHTLSSDCHSAILSCCSHPL